MKHWWSRVASCLWSQVTDWLCVCVQTNRWRTALGEWMLNLVWLVREQRRFPKYPDNTCETAGSTSSESAVRPRDELLSTNHSAPSYTPVSRSTRRVMVEGTTLVRRNVPEQSTLRIQNESDLFVRGVGSLWWHQRSGSSFWGHYEQVEGTKFALFLSFTTINSSFVSMVTIISVNSLSPVCLSTCCCFPGWFPFYL